MNIKQAIIGFVAIVLGIVALSFSYSANQSLMALELTNTSISDQLQRLENQQRQIRIELDRIETVELTKVRFTNYYENDELGSVGITSTGFRTSDFRVNDLGIYTYENKIVLATANNGYKIDTLPNGYKAYDYYDELNVVIDNVSYPAIVLDLCGACYWKEDYQRYDLFVSGKNASIDQIGYVY